MSNAQLDPGQVIYTTYQTADAEKDPANSERILQHCLWPRRTWSGCSGSGPQIEDKIPDQLALVTFDDHPFYPYLSPSITAVKQPIHELGRAAVEMLFALMGKEPVEKKQILPVEIIVRGSSQPVDAAEE